MRCRRDHVDTLNVCEMAIIKTSQYVQIIRNQQVDGSSPFPGFKSKGYGIIPIALFLLSVHMSVLCFKMLSSLRCCYSFSLDRISAKIRT